MGKIVEIVRYRDVEERQLKKAGNKNYKHEAEVNMQKRLAELNRDYIVKEDAPKPDDTQARELVDVVFNFLKDSDAVTTPTDIEESKAFMVRIYNRMFTMHV